ncbi:hypothetical protein PFISCL1PPCAC_2209, partial [Pristionchus fissidentatus]
DLKMRLISIFLVFCLAVLSTAAPQWGGGGTEVIERDIITVNNPWGGSETIEKDEVIVNNNNRGWNNGWNNNGWGNNGWNNNGWGNRGGYGGYNGNRWGRK